MIGFGKTNIRTRLTAWYTVVLAAVLLAYAVSASFLMSRDLRDQLARFAMQDLDTLQGLFYFDDYQFLHYRDEFRPASDTQDRIIEVWSESGDILYQKLGSRRLAGTPDVSEGADTFSEREITLTNSTRALMVSRRYTVEGNALLIRVAYSTEELDQQYRAALFGLLAPLPFVLAIAGFVGYYLARRSLEPIRTMAHRAQQITSERLDERLPINDTDGELADLGRIFNAMLSRLEQSFDQLRRFTSDASHELRTPLTLIRSVGEVGLQTSNTAEQYRDTIGSMLEEANRLTELVENLLTISRADAGQLALSPTTFPAIDLARESGSLLDVLLEEKSQRLHIHGDESLTISADRLLLRQALVNILHNAIKHSPVNSAIDIEIRKAGNIEIAVRDSGPGLTAEHQSRIFDRFYRVDTGRAASLGGVGLGLAIAQWVVRAHTGTITVYSDGSSGATFTIHLPAA